MCWFRVQGGAVRRLRGGKQRGNTGEDGASLKTKPCHLDTNDTQYPEDTPRCHIGRRNNVKEGPLICWDLSCAYKMN